MEKIEAGNLMKETKGIEKKEKKRKTSGGVKVACRKKKRVEEA